MSSSAAAAQQQYKLDANSNAIVLPLPLPLALPPSPTPTPTPVDRVEWSRATILGFIEDYRRQRVLWDPNTKGYHIKQTKYEALKLLSEKYGTEIRSIRSKIKSLRSSFHREHGKVLSGRNRGVLYQPMWFAYEAIRFILDGERDGGSALDGDITVMTVDGVHCDPDGDTETDEKLALMHSLDLEQLTAAAAAAGKQQQVVDQQREELVARIALAAVAAAAEAASARDRDRDLERDLSLDRDVNAVGAEEDLDESGDTGGGCRRPPSSATVTRSSSDLDGENYCRISAEDVKTEIIEHESEMGMLDRQSSTPSPINYYKPTDLTYNHRKRKALDENGAGVVLGMEHVVGALTLTPIKTSSSPATAQSLSQGQQMNHSQLAFHALQQHLNHNHNCNGQPQQHQQQQQQHQHQHQQQQNQALQQQQQNQQKHSTNMAQKRDRDRDLSALAGGNTTKNSNNNSNNHNGSSCHTSNTSLDLPTGTAVTSSNCSSSSSGATPSKQTGLSANHADEYGVFGEYVAITIRKLKTSKSKIAVKHLINNLLYEAELGAYDQGIPSTKEPPQLYKMQ
ncbi:AF4/FMR2 family member 4 [Drosophila miranda]|uniref:AF4/FMR2 family member 4 n=1 Tax=Drosophila miranda TaxID=7229 RepID=UPI0007E77156|nr:AF4/FMR2 family member 4 [Drosophila miranda]